MTTETQGKTTNPMDTQQENKEKILRVMTGYGQHASLFELQTVVLLDAQSRIHMLR
jgi:hypothetical protein